MTPYLADPDVTLYHGDCLDVLRELPDRSVHMCATSPPFYGLRDYGTDGQIGLEETPDQWVDRLVAVFEEVKRVLRDDATLWLELGDSFADKQLTGQPWRVAFALQRAGWFLRSEIIWARLRPNPMPESVTDRPTKSHSTVFLLSKRPRYFYDADAIREPPYEGDNGWRYYANRGKPQPLSNLPRHTGEGQPKDGGNSGLIASNLDTSVGANARSVWQIPTEPTPFAHFATWPRKLVARMILAGTSERGCCPECGAPWVREVTEASGGTTGKSWNDHADDETQGQRTGHGQVVYGTYQRRTTLGWSPSCSCAEGSGVGSSGRVSSPAPLSPVPCTVLDPFAGSGTTNLVARNHGRHSIGIELNEAYLKIAADRLSQLSLLA